MIKAGTWAENGSVEINNYYGINSLTAEVDYMDVHIGPNYASEVELVGSASMSAADAAAHPEYMSNAGTMSWDLQVEKKLAYSVGYGASQIASS